jgi:hypothetical protein
VLKDLIGIGEEGRVVEKKFWVEAFGFKTVRSEQQKVSKAKSLAFVCNSKLQRLTDR